MTDDINRMLQKLGTEELLGDEGEFTTIELSSAVLGQLSVLHRAESVPPIRLYCHKTPNDQIFKVGSYYPLCNITADGDVCILDKDGDHTGIASDRIAEHFALHLSEKSIKLVEIAISQSLDERAAKLKAAAAGFLSSELTDIKIGDLLMWKPGLKDGRLPAYGEPVIVLELVTEFKRDLRLGDHAAASQLDLIVGLIDRGNDTLIHFPVDSRRFMRYTPNYELRQDIVPPTSQCPTCHTC